MIQSYMRLIAVIAWVGLRFTASQSISAAVSETQTSSEFPCLPISLGNAEMETPSGQESRDRALLSTSIAGNNLILYLGLAIARRGLPKIGLHEDLGTFRHFSGPDTLRTKSIRKLPSSIQSTVETPSLQTRPFRKLYDYISDEFQVNTLTTGDQHNSYSESFTDNTQAVFWSTVQSDIGLRGQMYDKDWNKVGSEFEISETTIENEVNTGQAALLRSGSYVVCWHTSDLYMYARIYHKTVSQGPEFLVNNYDTRGGYARVAALQNGGFVIAWSAGAEIYAQVYDFEANKVGDLFVANTYTSGTQIWAQIVGLPNGNFVISWDGVGTEDDYGIYAQIFNSTGSTVGNQFLVNTYTTGEQAYSNLAVLTDGRFVIVWRSTGQDGDGYGAYGQIFDSSGNKIGSEFQPNQHTQGDQYPNGIDGLYDGGFITTWTDASGNDGDGDGIFARRYDQYGNPSGDQFQVNQYTDGHQHRTSVTATKCGFLVTWQYSIPGQSNVNVFGRVYQDSISSLRLSNPLQNLNAYKSQPFSFIIPVNTFHTSSGNPIAYSVHIIVDGQYKLMDSFWLSFDEATRAFSGTPTEEQTILVQVEGYDECGYTVDEFQLTVAANLKPVANALIPNQAIPYSKEAIWEYYVPKNTFKDLEGDPITYTNAVAVIEEEEADLGTVWETLTFDAVEGKLYGIPNLTGTFTVRIYADDGIGDPNPTSVDMNVEILSQGIEILQLYEVSHGGFKGFISSDDSHFWIADGSDLKQYDLSSANPSLVNGPSLQYSLSSSITAVAEISQSRIATGDDQGTISLLSSQTNSEISTLSVNEAITDIFNNDDDFIYVSHSSSVSTLQFTTVTLQLSSTNALTKSVTSIAKTGNLIYAGTEEGLFRIDTLTNTSIDLNIPDLGYIYDIQIHETYLYIVKEYQLMIYDISDPDAISLVNTRVLEGLATSILVLKIDSDVLVFIAEESKGLSVLNTSNPSNISFEGYYSSISTVNSAYVSSEGTWGIALRGSNVFTFEIFRRNIQLQVCDTSSDPCSDQLEIQALKDFSKDVIVSELFPTFKTDFIYGLSYSYTVLQVSGSNYQAAPDWLSSSKVNNKLFRLSGQAPEYLIGSVVDLEVQAFAFESDGEKLLTLKKVVSLSIVPRHASVVSSIPDQSLQVGEEWLYSFSESVFSGADDLESEYFINSEWIKSYDISFIRFTPASRQWHISSLDSTQENLFGCNPCNNTEYSATYIFKVTAKNSASDSDPGVSTTFNVYIYSGRIPDQQTHPGISQTIVLDESIFPPGIEYTVSLLDSDGNTQALPWWMSFISNERKILMFPSASEIDQDFDIQISGNNNGAELTSGFQIQVRNDFPVAIEELQNQRVKLGESLDFSFSSDTFSDPDDDPLSYTVQWKKEDGSLTTAIPSWITFSESTLTFYGSPSVQESYTLVIYASDGLGGQASIEFAIEAYNNAPYPNPESSLPDQVHHIGLLFSLTLPSNLFTDPDKDSLTYSALQSDGSELPSWLIFSPSSLYFSGTPSASSLIGTSIKIQVSASDGYSSSSSSFNISITNSPPQASAMQNQTVHIGELFSLSLPSSFFSDPDEDVLVYSVDLEDGSPLPSWLIFNSVTLSFSGTPADLELENSSLDIKMSASDGYSSAESSFSLSITNTSPQASPIEDQSVHIGTLFSFTLLSNLFTDEDGDSLQYSVSQVDGSNLPSWLAFNSFSLQFSGTPTSLDLENTTLDIRVSVSDGYSSAESDFTVSITNTTPQANAIENQSVHIGTLFSFTLPSSVFTDQDGDSLMYTVSQVDGSSLPSWLSFSSTIYQFSGTPTSELLENTTLDIRVSVSDGYSSAESDFTISITNSAPQASSIEDQSVHIGTIYSFTLPSNSFTDDDGDLLEYTVSQADGSSLPSWLSFSSTIYQFSGTPTSDLLENTTLDIKISVSDGYSSVETTFTISITNSAPEASSIEDQSVHIGTMYSYTFPSSSFTDDDGDSLEYSVSQADGSPLPSWLSFNPTFYQLFGTPTAPELENTSVSVKISVSDGYSSAETTFSISITNSAPQASSIEDQSVHIGTIYSFTLPSNSFTDDDGDLLEYTVSQADGSSLPSWLSFSSTIYQFSGTPTSELLENTTLDIKIIVSDGYSSAQADFSLSITNDPPTLTSSLNSQISLSLEQGFIKFKPGVPFEYIISSNTFADSDNDILTFTARLSNGDPLPEWLSFDSNTQQFFGTPTQTETLSISVTAFDGYASVSDTFEMNITNELPVLNKPLQTQFDSLYPDPFVEGLSFSFQFAEDTFLDQDDSLSYSALFSQDGGEWRSLDFIWVELEGRTLSGTVSASSTSDSTLSIQLTASDGLESVSDIFSLTILSPFPSPSLSKIHIESMKDSIEVEIFTTGPKISVFSYGTLSALDTSNGEKTHWKIEGSPSDVNYVLERVKYRPSSNRILSDSGVYIKMDGQQQEYPLSVFTAEESIVSYSIPDQSAYIDSTYSTGIKKYFNYSDESLLTYSLVIEKKPSGYKDWLNFESGVISGVPSDPREIGSYTIRITAMDEFDESESESFNLTVDYSELQKYIIMITFIAQFVGPTLTVISLIAYKSKIYNFFTKKKKIYAPLQLVKSEISTRELLILRPDEEKVALKLFKKMPELIEIEDDNLISSLESVIIEINKDTVEKTPMINSVMDESSDMSFNKSFGHELKTETAPMINIKGSKYHSRFLFFCVKDYMYKKTLTKPQQKELDKLVKYFKQVMSDQYTMKLLSQYDSMTASKWIRCKDAWTREMPDLTKSLNTNCEEIKEFLNVNQLNISPEIILNRIKIEQWKDRSVRIVSKASLKKLELYQNSVILYKVPWIRYIQEWVYRKWFSVSITENELTMQINIKEIKFSDELYVRMFDSYGYLICWIMILPKSRSFNVDLVEENLDKD